MGLEGAFVQKLTVSGVLSPNPKARLKKLRSLPTAAHFSRSRKKRASAKNRASLFR